MTVPKETADARVLVVDEPAVADVYALRLRDRFEPVTAESGEDAVDAIDEGVDVVLLDGSVDDDARTSVLDEIRQRDDVEARVVPLTSVDGGRETVEGPVDDTVCNPVRKPELVAAVERRLAARRYDDRLAEYLAATSESAASGDRETVGDGDGSDPPSGVDRRAARAGMEDALADFDDADAAFEELDGVREN